MAVARARHEIIGQIVGALDHRIRQRAEVLVGKGIGAYGFFWINGEVLYSHFDLFRSALLFLQNDFELHRLPLPENEFVESRIEAWPDGPYAVFARFNGFE